MNIVGFAARAAIWKTTPQPPAVGLRAVAICWLLTFVGSLAHEYAAAGEQVRFSPHGLNADLACLFVTLAVAAALVRTEWRATVLATLGLLSCFLSLAYVGLALALRTGASGLAGPSWWTSNVTSTVLFVAHIAWWLGALTAVFRSIEPERRRAFPRAFAFYAVLCVAILLPYYPTFRGDKFDSRTANLWAYIPALLNGELNAQDERPERLVDEDEIALAQPALLDAQFAALSSRAKGRTNIYAIGIAGSADQDVFRSELKGGLDSLSRVLSLDGHIVKLINHPEAVETLPVASRQNIATAVRAVARVMDRDEDVLLLFATSHGSPKGIALHLPGAIYGFLAPDDVATLLAQSGIKNRIIVVSACYSGVFLKPLADDHTIIITAADENHTSFGCSNEREWTYFGDAFFNRALDGGTNLEAAFLDARRSIAEWEARDGLTPSNPQGHFGAALMKKLEPVYQYAKHSAGARADGGPGLHADRSAP